MSKIGSLSNARVAVVGASSGTGLAVAQAASELGAHVLLMSRTREKLEAIRESLKGSADAIPMDMLDEESVTRAFAGISSIDHLVITAVADENKLRSPLSSMSTEIAQRGMEKFWGSFFVSRAAAPLISAGGSITLTSSVSIYKPSASGGVSVMSAASGAVATFGRSLAAELAPVRVNVIAPGVVNTGVWAESSEEERSSLESWAEESLPVKHLGDAEELAAGFIALMLNSYITGAVLPIDGGLALT